MRFAALVMLVAVAVGVLAGGNIRGLAKLRTRWTALALVGLALQVLPPAGPWSLPLLYASFVLLSVFCVVNLRTAGFALILAGTLMNFLVIGVNQGMPVGRAALVDSGQQDTLDQLIRGGGVKHHLEGPDDQLLFLADVLPIPPPIGRAASAGDVVAYVGVCYLVIAAMRADRRPRRVPVQAAGAAVDG